MSVLLSTFLNSSKMRWFCHIQDLIRWCMCVCAFTVLYICPSTMKVFACVTVRRCVKLCVTVQLLQQWSSTSQMFLLHQFWLCDILFPHSKSWPAGVCVGGGNDLTRHKKKKKFKVAFRELSEMLILFIVSVLSTKAMWEIGRQANRQIRDLPLVESKNSCNLPGVPSSSSYSWAWRIISRRSNSFTNLASGLLWVSYSYTQDKRFLVYP